MLAQETITDKLVFEPVYVRADAGKRFANYILDIIVYYILMFVIGMLYGLIFPEYVDENATYLTGSQLYDTLLSIFIYILYMSLVEGLFYGKSVGKLITGTRAVNLDGSRISIGTAFGRGFSRAVPFCPFSAFGTPCNPWQDDWTNTMVIDSKKSVLE
jgi:uncharacterized RDD family membrane protein YckC